MGEDCLAIVEPCLEGRRMGVSKQALCSGKPAVCSDLVSQRHRINQGEPYCGLDCVRDTAGASVSSVGALAVLDALTDLAQKEERVAQTGKSPRRAGLPSTASNSGTGNLPLPGCEGFAGAGNPST